MATWTVKHYYHNPARNRTEKFNNKADAIEAAKGISSDDTRDTQCSYIENTATGEWGKRTWGKRNIEWHKK